MASTESGQPGFILFDCRGHRNDIELFLGIPYGEDTFGREAQRHGGRRRAPCPSSCTSTGDSLVDGEALDSTTMPGVLVPEVAEIGTPTLHVAMNYRLGC